MSDLHPRLPLRTSGGPRFDSMGRGIDVFDADGYWMATFRNKEDVSAYIAATTARINSKCAEIAARR